MLHGIRIKYPTFSPPEAQSHLDAILDVREAGLRTNLSGLLFLLPLKVAGWLSSNRGDRERIVAMLRQIATRFTAADAYMRCLEDRWSRATGFPNSSDVTQFFHAS